MSPEYFRFDEVTRLKLRVAAPDTMTFLHAAALVEIDRLGADLAAKSAVCCVLYELALSLNMHTTGRTRAEAVERLHELGMAKEAVG